MGLTTIIKDSIFEKSSWDLDFDVFEKDKTTPLTPSSLKVYVLLKDEEDTPTYINGRDGTDGTGLTSVANAVSLHLDPADNQVVGTDAYADLPYEDHIVIIEILYNANNDQDFFVWHLRIRNLQPVA